MYLLWPPCVVIFVPGRKGAFHHRFNYDSIVSVCYGSNVPIAMQACYNCFAECVTVKNDLKLLGLATTRRLRKQLFCRGSLHYSVVVGGAVVTVSE